MLVLGIHDGHNASAALLKDGEVIAAAQEERFTRVKNQGGMPVQAMEEVLRVAGARKDDVDRFAVADKYHGQSVHWDRDSVLKRFGESRSLPRILFGRLQPVRAMRRRQLASRRLADLSEFGFPEGRTDVVEHHECHASAAFYSRGYSDQEVLVLTADAAGDYLSASVNIGKKGTLRRVAEIPDIHSLGQVYSTVTYLLGMVPYEHEYKVMGLAPYAAHSVEHIERVAEKFRQVFRFEEAGITWTTTDRFHIVGEWSDLLKDLLDRERFDWVAGGLQTFFEEMLLSWVENCVRETGVRAVALGGGVFMNVKANKRILESPLVESLFVMPSSGDESNSLGAAYSACAAQPSEPGGCKAEALGHLYLGNEIADSDAEKALLEVDQHLGIHWRYSQEPEREVAALLAQGKAVARAAGRMEFGARALGNRSILADPSNSDIVSLINDMIKDRDFWMPFAPSVLVERSDEYFVKPKRIQSPYMALAFDARPENHQQLRAASHPSDHTVRPQEVIESWNPPYHQLIRHFEELTGNATVLNTSLNLHGFPIVCTANDAMEVFVNSGLEFMQLASFIVWKDRSELGGAL